LTSCLKGLAKSCVRAAQICSIGVQCACRADLEQPSGILAGLCLPSRLSRVRASSPAFFLCIASLSEPLHPKRAMRASERGDGIFGEYGCRNTLPRFWATSCLTWRDIRPKIGCHGRNILPLSSCDALPPCQFVLLKGMQAPSDIPGDSLRCTRPLPLQRCSKRLSPSRK